MYGEGTDPMDFFYEDALKTSNYFSITDAYHQTMVYLNEIVEESVNDGSRPEEEEDVDDEPRDGAALADELLYVERELTSLEGLDAGRKKLKVAAMRNISAVF